MRGFYAEDFMLRKNAYGLARRQGAADLNAPRIPPDPVWDGRCEIRSVQLAIGTECAYDGSIVLLLLL